MSARRLTRSDFIRLVREDWITHGRDWTRPGFRALIVYRFGVWLTGLRYRIVRGVLARLQLVMYRYVRAHYGIELPPTAKVGRRLLIAHQSGIVIHTNAEIGDDCMIRHNVTIGARSQKRWWEAPKLGNGVQVGCGASILGDITVGDDVIIGANAVVAANVPSGVLVVVQPPRMIRKQSEEATQRASDLYAYVGRQEAIDSADLPPQNPVP